MKISTLIVDDEQVARDVLKNYIHKYCTELEIIDEAENAKTAIEKIKKLQPKLVFLDVEMPFGNAFDVLEATQELDFEVIFVTAYSHYSIQALNQSASYYILKPVSIEELERAVEKVSQNIKQKSNVNSKDILLQNKRLPSEDQRIVLPTQNGFDVAQCKEIQRLQADGNFTKVFFNSGKSQLVCRFLKHFETTLKMPFIRIHRSHIINTNYIQSFQKGQGGTVVMKDGYEVEVSPTYKENLMRYFESLG